MKVKLEFWLLKAIWQKRPCKSKERADITPINSEQPTVCQLIEQKYFCLFEVLHNNTKYISLFSSHIVFAIGCIDDLAASIDLNQMFLTKNWPLRFLKFQSNGSRTTEIISFSLLCSSQVKYENQKIFQFGIDML